MPKIPHILLYLLVFTTLIWLSRCTERSRDNPFDPNSNSKTRVNLSVEPENNQAHLSWSVENIQDFTGFIIYRSVDGSEFVRYQEIAPSFTTFTDTALNYYQWYKVFEPNGLTIRLEPNHLSIFDTRILLAGMTLLQVHDITGVNRQ